MEAVSKPGPRAEVRGWVAAALALGALALYARVRGHAFLHYDDDLYVTANAAVRAGLTWEGVRWALGSLQVFNWHPLTWLSHMLDVELFGLAPAGPHLVNAALHAANAALLYLVLERLTGARWRSALVAALFAVHPLHVESVAWVSERKDVLSTLFGLLALAAYARHAARPRPRSLALVALALAASLACKPMWVTLPFLLLLLDLWPLRRVEGALPAGEAGAPAAPALPLRALVVEKLPLLALSAAASAVAVLAQQRGGAVRGAELGLGLRAGNACVSAVRYLAKAAWPSGLSPHYPHPGAALPAWQAAGAALLLAALTALALARARRWPWLAVGWFWYLGTLVPVSGLVQAGGQAMADRYTYLPLVGVFLAAAWGGAAALEAVGGRREAPRRAAAAAVALLLAALSAATWRQAGYWSSHVALFARAAAVEPASGVVRSSLSQGLAVEGRIEEAVQQAREAVRLEPGVARFHKNLGYMLFRAGRVEESVEELRAAVALQPDYPEAHGNLAVAYGRLGQREQAAWHKREEQRLLREARR